MFVINEVMVEGGYVSWGDGDTKMLRICIFPFHSSLLDYIKQCGIQLEV